MATITIPVEVPVLVGSHADCRKTASTFLLSEKRRGDVSGSCERMGVSAEAALPNDAHKGVNLSIYQAFTEYRAWLEHVEELLETAGKTLVEQGKKLEELQETTELLRQIYSSR